MLTPFVLVGIHCKTKQQLINRYGFTRKRRKKDEKHIGKLTKMNPKIKSVYQFYISSRLNHRSRESLRQTKYSNLVVEEQKLLKKIWRKNHATYNNKECTSHKNMEVEPVEPALMYIYQNNTYRKYLSWQNVDDEPRVAAWNLCHFTKHVHQN